MRNYVGTCKVICSYSLVYNFLIQLLPLKSSVFVVHFSNAFWYGNRTFPKVSSQNEIFPLLVIFYLPYSKYRGMKICFYSCCYQNQLVSHSCCTRATSVAFVSLVSGTCVVNQTRSLILSCDIKSHPLTININLFKQILTISYKKTDRQYTSTTSRQSNDQKSTTGGRVLRVERRILRVDRRVLRVDRRMDRRVLRVREEYCE